MTIFTEKNDFMKTLVVVDLQKDFWHPQGRLSVKDADKLPACVAAAIPDYDNVIFTLDWHPLDHCSFASQGGLWPEHCVQYTEGASLPFEVLKSAQNKNVMLYFKGRNRGKEEYGAFACIGKEQLNVLQESEQIVVCGLCGDYCVGQTIRNLAALGFAEKLFVDMACTGSIDDGSTLEGIINEFNLKKI